MQSYFCGRKYRLVTLLLAVLLACVLLIAFPRMALADDAVSAGSGDVDSADPTDALSTATINEHQIQNEETIPNSDPATTTNDRMDQYSDATKLTDYTFNNTPKTEVTVTSSDDGAELESSTVTNTDSAVQRAVAAALEAIDSNSATITIIIKDGVYNGDVNITLPAAALATVNDDLKIVLAAHDALATNADGSYQRVAATYTDDDGEATIPCEQYVYTANSAGNVRVNGNFTIDGINVVLAGIYLAMGNTIKVSDAELQVFGTAAADNYDVSLSSSKAAFTDCTGVKVYGGAGNDTIKVDIPTNVAKNTLGIGDYAPRGGVYLYGEGGNDTITVSGRAPAVLEDPLTIAAYGGAGDDLLTLSLSVVNSASSVILDGGDGAGDRAHFLGALKAVTGDESNIRQLGDKIIFTADCKPDGETDNRSLTVTATGIESYTDGLTNKAEVVIKTIGADGICKDADGSEISLTSLTNYTYYNSPAGKIVIGSGDVFLSNLVFQAETLTIRYEISAPSLNLVFNGKEISFERPLDAEGNPIDFTVEGACIIVTALDTDTQFGFNYGAEPEVDTGTYKVAFSLFDCASVASILVGEGVTLNASGGALSLSATTAQTKGMIDLAGATGSLNFINVKVGSATIDIQGSLTAAATVTAAAKATVSVNASNDLLSKAFIPLAVSVCVLEADVTVGANAVITAQRSVSLSTATSVTLTSKATTGKLPISLAVSVAVINSHVNVYGKVYSISDNVSLAASGNATVTTTATKGANPPSFSVFGGFFAFSVVIQDVSAAVCRLTDDNGLISRGGQISAGNGDVSITSISNENVTTTATSASAASAGSGSDSGEQSTMSSVKLLVSSLLGEVMKNEKFNSLKDSLLSTFKNAISKVIDKIKGTDGAVIKKSDTENGKISLSSAKAAPGSTITVSATPDTDYHIGALTYTYLAAGESAFKTAASGATGTLNGCWVIQKDSDGKYSFVVPTNATYVIVYASFEKGAVNTDEDGEDLDIGDLFTEEDDNETGIDDIVNEGAGGTDEEADTGDYWFDKPKTAVSGEYTITSAGTMTNGAVLSNVRSAKTGEKVWLLINPASSHIYKEDSLSVKLSDGTTVSCSNKGGLYYFTMPNANVEISCEFTATGNTSQTPATESSRSVQATGALAVGITINNNNAYIDTSRSVTAGGALTLKANAKTKAVVTADATGVLPSADTAATATADPDAGSAGNVGTQKAAKPDEKIGTVTFSYGQPWNGSISKLNTGLNDAGNYIFTLTPDAGYRLDTTAGSATFTYTDEMGEEHTVNLTKGSGDNDTWMLNKSDVPSGMAGVLRAKFEAITVGLGINTPTNGKATLPGGVSTMNDGKKGDWVVLTVTPDAGYKVESITVSEGGAVIATISGTALSSGDGNALQYTSDIYRVCIGENARSIVVTFGQKGNEIFLAEVYNTTGGSAVDISADGAAAQWMTFSDTRVDGGEQVTLNKGAKLIEGAYNYTLAYAMFNAAGEMTGSYSTITGSDLSSWTVPENPGTGRIGIQLSISEDASKTNTVTYTDTSANGGTVSGPKKAASNETLTFIITPSTGKKIASVTVKTTVGTSDPTTTTVKANSAGAYTYTVPVLKNATASIVVTGVFADDPSNTGTAAAKSSVSLGVAVNVTVTQHKNNAYIASGNIEADALSVTAASGSSQDRMVSKAVSAAGYSAGDIGIGGAVSVHIVGAKTRALILTGQLMYVAEDGDDDDEFYYSTKKTTVQEAVYSIIVIGAGALKLAAEAHETYVTQADANSSDKAAGKLGVGAGIAVAVVGVDTVAGLENGLRLTQKADTKLSSIAITALNNLSETMKAIAGSAGGISITPVLALDISGVCVQAYLGDLASHNALYSTGDVKLSAESKAARQVAANAAASGKTAVGGSFAITILNDSATAYVKNSLHARNVSISALARSSLKSTSRASASGAAGAGSTSAGSGDSGSTSGDSEDSDDGSESGEADKQADGYIEGGSKFSGKTGSSNTNSQSILNSTNGRQTAQTSEGTIQVAAGFTLNIQTNRSEAYLAGGITVIADDYDGDPATVDPDNGKLSITAQNDTDAAIYANASATKATTGVGVAVAINIVNYDNLVHIDDAAITANYLTLTATVAPLIKKTVVQASPTPDNIVDIFFKETVLKLVDELAETLGIASMFEDMTLSFTLSNGDSTNDPVEYLADLVGQVMGNMAASLLNGSGLENLLSANIEEMVKEQITKLKQGISNFLTLYPEGEQRNAMLKTMGTELLSATLSQLAQIVMSDLATGFTNAGIGTLQDKITKALGDTFKNAGAAVRSTLMTQLTNAGNSVLEYLVGNLIDIQQLKAFINSLKTNVAGVMQSKLQEMIKGTVKALATSALDQLSNWLSLDVEVAPTVPQCAFVTQAIAGAGASKVGVAGSVAVAVVNGTTKALIGDLPADSAYDALRSITVYGDTVIKAESNQADDITGTSAVTSSGLADKNTQSGASDGDSGDGSTGTGLTESTDGTGENASKLVVDASVGGTVKISGTQTKDQTISIIVTIDDGYMLDDENVTVTRSDTKAKLTVTAPTGPLNAESFTYTFIMPDLLAEGVPDDAKLTIKVGFEEDLRTISFEGNTNGQITTDAAGNKAKAGDRVVVKLTPAAGYKLQLDATHKVTLKYQDVDDKAKTADLTVIEENGGQTSISYVFTMPEIYAYGDTVKGLTISATFCQAEATDPNPGGPTTSPTANSSKTIGVGASFGLDLSTMTVYAGVGTNRTVTTGTIDVTADCVHDAETITASGTDPLSTDGAGDQGATKDVSLDASAAVTLVYNYVRAYIDENTGITVTGVNRDMSGIDYDAKTFTDDDYNTMDDEELLGHIVYKLTATEYDAAYNASTVTRYYRLNGAAFEEIDGTPTLHGEYQLTARVNGCDYLVYRIGSGESSYLVYEFTKRDDSKGYYWRNPDSNYDFEIYDLPSSAAPVAEQATYTDNDGNVYYLYLDDELKTAAEKKEDFIRENCVLASMRIQATQTGKSLTMASGFSAGGETAVGAGVALSIIYSYVDAEFLGNGVLRAGGAFISAETFDQDVVKALATAIGADMDRISKKYKNTAATAEETANDVTSGEICDKNSTTNSGNKTSSTVNGELDKNGNSEQEGEDAEKTNNNNSTSTNVLKSQNTQTEGEEETKDTTDEGKKATKDNTDTSKTQAEDGSELTGADTGATSNKLQVAAAVGLNITQHKAHANLAGSLTATAVDMLAENHGNFQVKASGIAMSFALSANSIGAAVALSVNKNEAIVLVGGDVTTTGTADQTNISGSTAAGTTAGFSAKADMTQNMDGLFPGLLAAQAIAGAASGNGSRASVAGAIAIVVSYAKSGVTMVGGTSDTDRQLLDAGSGDIEISATDKSKISLRAGAISVSKGSAVGVGASFALVYAHNEIFASVGDNMTIRGGGFSLSAEKKAVTMDDYVSAFGLSNLFTDSTFKSSGIYMDDATRAALKRSGKLGMIDIHKKDANAAYTVDLNISTDGLLNAIDLMNFLSMNNYYAEAIAGSIDTGATSTASVGGSIAMIFFYNSTCASIGNNVTAELSGDMTLSAADHSTARIIAGALSFSNAKAGVGVTIAFLLNRSAVETRVGRDQETITVTDGDETQRYLVYQSDRISLYERLDGNGIATGEFFEVDSTFGKYVACTYDLSTYGTLVPVSVNPNVSITAGGAYTQSAACDSDILVITAAATINTNAASSAAVSGAINAIAAKNTVRSLAASRTRIVSGGDMNISSSMDMSLTLASLALAGTAGTVGVGATIAVVVDESESQAVIGDATTLISTGGSISVKAANADKLINVLAALSIAKSGSIAGTLGVLVSLSDTRAAIGDDAVIQAGKGITVAALGDAWQLVIEISLSAAPNGIAVGATILVNVFERLLLASVGQRARLSAGGGSVDVRAEGEDWYLGIALAVAGGTNGVAGTIPVLVSQSTLTAEILSGSSDLERTVVTAYDSIGVISYLVTHTYLVAGGVAAGSTAGVGATISTAVIKNSVSSVVGDYVSLIANGKYTAGSVTDAGVYLPNRKSRRRGVIVSAIASEDIVMASVSAGVGGTAGVSGVVNTLVARNVVRAALGDNVKVETHSEAADGTGAAPSTGSDFVAEADDESTIMNFAGALGVGGTAGVGATVVILVFTKDVQAYVGGMDANGHVLPSTGSVSAAGDVSVTAAARDDLWLMALAFGAAGTAGVAGDVNVLVFQNNVIAALGGSVSASGDAYVTASSHSELYNIGAGLGAGGVAGISAVAVVTYFYNNTEAYVTAGGSVAALSGSILIGAYSEEFVTADAAGVAGGGTAGVGGTIDVIITKVVTLAYTESGVTLMSSKTAGNLTVQAVDSYELIAIVVTAAVAGVAGVGVTVLVSVSYNSIGATIGQGNTVSGYDVSVLAASNRDVLSVSASLAGGGVAGVGATASVILVGSRPDQDTHDTIYPDEVQEMYTFDPDGDVSSKLGDPAGLVSLPVYLTKTGDKVVKLSYENGTETVTEYYLINANGTLGDQYTGKTAGESMVSVDQQQIFTDSDDNSYMLYTDADGDMLYVKLDSDGNETSDCYYRSGTAMIQIEGGYTGTKTPYIVSSVMDPQTQVDASFSEGNSKALHEDGSSVVQVDSLDDMLASDGSGDAVYDKDYSEFGQDTSGQLYIYDSLKNEYTPVSETDNKHTYFKKDASGSFVAASKDDLKTSDSGMQADEAHDDTASIEISPSAVTVTASGETVTYNDSTAAVIAGGASVTAYRDLSVEAADAIKANMISGTLAIGGVAGVGVGVSVAVLFSDVRAVVEDGATLSAGGALKVSAVSGASPSSNAFQTPATDGSRDFLNSIANVNSTADSKTGGAGSTIRLIGVTAAGGLVGVGVSIAVLTVFSSVTADICGDVIKANTVDVEAGLNYGQVLTVTLAIAGGACAVSVSAGVAYFEASVRSAISGDAEIGSAQSGTATVGNVSVTTHGCANAIAAAAGVAAGGVAVNAGVALVINRTRVDNFIGQGVTLNSSGAVKLAVTGGNGTGSFESNAKAFIISASFGAVAVGATVAVSINRLSVYSFIGATPDSAVAPAAGAKANGAAGRITAASVEVSSSIAGASVIHGFGVSGGVIAVNGIVALAFNRIVNYAAIYRANIEASGGVTAQAALSGDTEVITTSLVGGFVAVGATVALAQIKSANWALVDLTGAVMKAASLSVNAGTGADSNNSEARAIVLTGTAGYISVALNFAVALNDGSNRAVVRGTGVRISDTESSGCAALGVLNIAAVGNAHAYAVVANVSVSKYSVNISSATALLTAVQEAMLGGKAFVTVTGSLTVSSSLNEKTPSTSYSIATSQNAMETLRGRFSNMAQAYIFSASAGAVAVTANCAAATANATGRAKAAAADLKVTDDITVHSAGTSNASAIIQNISFGLVAVGVMVGYSYAEGTFEALLESSGSITARNISVTTEYVSFANSEVAPAAGGVALSLASGMVNVAYAETKSAAIAGLTLTGLGTVTADGDVTVNVTGKSTASAVIKGVEVSIGAVAITINVVNAEVLATQKAYIKGAPLSTGDTPEANTLTAKSVSVLSTMNNTEGCGAVATVGSNGSSDSELEIELVSVDACVATALFNGASSAYIDGAGLELTGTLTVNNKARSYAKADVATAANSVTGICVSLLLTDANASGTFMAYINGGAGKTIAAATIDVNNTYYAISYAGVGPAGEVGVELRLVTISANLAYASNACNAYAYISGTGTIQTAGDFSVTTTGYTRTLAEGRTRSFSISLANVAVNQVSSTLNINQSAYLSLGSGCIMQVGGSLSVFSDIVSVEPADPDVNLNDGYGYALSRVGGPTGSEDGNNQDVSISLFGVTVNTARSYARTNNSAFVSGSGSGDQKSLIQVGGDMLVKARTISNSKAYAVTALGVGLFTIGSLTAVAYTADSVDSYVSNVRIEAEGDVSVVAIGNATAYAYCAKPGNISLLSVSIARADAQVGYYRIYTVEEKQKADDSDETEIVVKEYTDNNTLYYQQVKARTLSGTDIVSGGDVLIRAYNAGSASTEINNGTTVSFASISVTKLPTSGHYRTEASIDGNVTADGSIKVSAEDYTAAVSEAIGTSIGFGINAVYTKGWNSIGASNSVTVRGTLAAGKSLTVQAVSTAFMIARSYADGGGFFSGTMLEAGNELSRSAAVTILSGAVLSADFGDLTIKASAGAGDQITTESRIVSGGVVALGSAESTTDIDSSSTVSIGSGTSITNRFNAVNIYAEASMKRSETITSVDTYGLGVRPYAHADSNLKLVSAVNITGLSGSLVTIEGRYVNIEAYVGELSDYAYAYASGEALGANVDAYADMGGDGVSIDANAKLEYATITGHDGIKISSAVQPAYNGESIYANAVGRLNAVGKGFATAEIDGHVNNSTVVGKGVTLIGTGITVERHGFAAGDADYAATMSGFIIKKSYGYNTLTISNTASIENGLVLHLGDAAGGVHIDIYEVNGEVRIRAVGVRNDAQNWVIGSETITFGDIVNALPGYARLNVDTMPVMTVFDQTYIPEVTIVNRTDRNLIFGAITVNNVNFVNPIVRNLFGYAIAMPCGYGVSNASGTITRYRSADMTPVIRITNLLSANVHFKGLIANPTGDLIVEWTETDADGSLVPGGELSAEQSVVSLSSGSLVAPIWIRSLTVTNAAKVGAEDQTVSGVTTVRSFNVYLVNYQNAFSTDDGYHESTIEAAYPLSNVSVTAWYGAYLMLTATELVMLSTAQYDAKPWLEDGANTGDTVDMEITNVLVTDGDVIITLPLGRRIYQLKNSAMVTMPVPGTLEYLTYSGALRNLAANTTIKGIDALSRYLQSYNVAEDSYCFLLPNGTYLYTDSLGNILRISEGGVEMAISDYAFERNDAGLVTSITLKAGVTIDLTTGLLNVASDTNFDILLSAVSGKWLLDNIRDTNGSIELVLVTTNEPVKNADGEYVFTTTKTTAKLSLWWSNDQLAYYNVQDANGANLLPGMQTSASNYVRYVLAYDRDEDTLKPFIASAVSPAMVTDQSDTLRDFNYFYISCADEEHELNDNDEDDSGLYKDPGDWDDTYVWLRKVKKNGQYYYDIDYDYFVSCGSDFSNAVKTTGSSFFWYEDFAGKAGLYLGFDGSSNSNTWAVAYKVGDEVKSFAIFSPSTLGANDFLYVADNNAGDNLALQQLVGIYWTSSYATGNYTPSTGDDRFAFDLNSSGNLNVSTDRGWLWSRRFGEVTFVKRVHTVTYFTLTPTSLMLAADSATADTENPTYTLTFGSPIVNGDVSGQYWVIENGEAKLQTVSDTVVATESAMLNVQGAVTGIPIKLQSQILANHVLDADTEPFPIK